jgi:hypothetical protein
VAKAKEGCLDESTRKSECIKMASYWRMDFHFQWHEALQFTVFFSLGMNLALRKNVPFVRHERNCYKYKLSTRAAISTAKEDKFHVY